MRIDRHTQVVIKCAVAAVTVGLLAWGTAAGAYLIAAIVVAVLFLDLANPFSLRNYFLVYTVGLLGVGSRLLIASDAGPVERDLLVYVLAFVPVYGVVRMYQPASRPRRDDESQVPASPGTTKADLQLLKGLVAAQLVLVLAPQLAHYGVRGFYGGQGLVDLIGNYGKASVAGGVQVILDQLLSALVIAAVVLYVRRCLDLRQRINYRVLTVVLIVTPLLLLERSSVLLDAVTLGAIYSVDRRFGVRRRRRQRGLLPVLAVLAAFAAAFAIGSLRETRLVGAGSAHVATGTVTGDLLRSEFSPVVAYDDIKTHPDLLGRPHGAPVIEALATRFVPRAWIPGKPQTSTAYYMEKIHPGPFAAGYAIAPSVYGVAYLNFGRPGCVLAVIVLAIAAAELDRGYITGQMHRLVPFLLVFANFYSIMRDDLSNAIARLVITGVAYVVLEQRYGVAPSPAMADRRLPEAAPATFL